MDSKLAFSEGKQEELDEKDESEESEGNEAGRGTKDTPDTDEDKLPDWLNGVTGVLLAELTSEPFFCINKDRSSPSNGSSQAQ